MAKLITRGLRDATGVVPATLLDLGVAFLQSRAWPTGGGLARSARATALAGIAWTLLLAYGVRPMMAAAPR